MTVHEKAVWLSAAIALIATSAVSSVRAQGYPNKPIRILVGTAAGGGADTTARTIGQRLSDVLGQPVVVENRTGAAGSIAIASVAASPADGYTLLLLASSAAILPALRVKLPYNLERDFAAVSLVTSSPNVLVVHPSVPAKTVKDLIALARSRPGQLSYASSGIGGSSHLMGELFNLMANVKILHVPYKGGAESVVHTAAGQIDMNYPSITSALPLINANKLRALAVTSGNRSSQQPSLPTIAESGLPGYDRSSWYGICAPAAVPKDIIMRLSSVIVRALATAELKELYFRQGLEAQGTTPEQYATFLQKEIAQNIKLVNLIGLKAE